MKIFFDYGKIVIISLVGCSPKKLEQEKLSKILDKACRLAKATVLETFTQEFPGEKSPIPITMFKALSESECSAHTYTQPGENMGISIVFYTCGEKSNPLNSLKYLKKAFEPKYAQVSKMIKITPDNPIFSEF